MLPSFYRFKVRSDGGQTATVTVNWQPYKIVGGVTTYGTAAALTNLSAASIAAAASATSPSINNTVDKYHGGFAEFTVNPAATPTGNQTWLLFVEKSNDGVTFGTQEEHFLASLLLTTTGVARCNAELRP